MASDEEKRRSSVDSSDMEALQKGITTRVLADRLRNILDQVFTHSKDQKKNEIIATF